MKEYFTWLAKFITIVVIFFIFVPAVLISIISSNPVETIAVSDSTKKSVAVIELEGIIYSSKKVLRKIYKHIKDDNVEGIVLRINSPGGAVAPAQDIYSTIKKLKTQKPIVVSMASVAASGGLYASLSASKVYCQPGTLTGSIGVILEVPNLSKLASELGVNMVTIKSGKYKDAGNMFREMTVEDREFLQATVDEAQAAFVQAVVEGRSLSLPDVKKFSDGRVLLGSQAKELQLVDEFGDLFDAARAVYALTGNPLAEDEHPRLLYPTDRFEDIKKFLETIVRIPEVLDGRTRLMYLMQ